MHDPVIYLICHMAQGIKTPSGHFCDWSERTVVEKSGDEDEIEIEI